MAAKRKPHSLPGFLPFQHPRLVERPPGGAGWVHEVKLDGYRMQLRVEAGRATWFTRTGLDWSDRLPDFAEDAAGLPDAILDGELCALGPDGQPSFSALRGALGRRQAGHVEGDLVFYVFDLLWEGAADLRARALSERRARLDALLDGGTARLTVVQPIDAPGADLFAAACAMGLEGIVSKRLDSPYQGGEARPGTWVKAKCRPVEEIVLGGWRAKGPHVQKLLAGVYDGDRFTYVGGIAPGSGALLEETLRRLRALEVPASPFVGEQPKRRDAELHFARPELVGRIEMAEWTASGALRQASFKGLRDDKPARDVRRETPEETPPPKLLPLDGGLRAGADNDLSAQGRMGPPEAVEGGPPRRLRRTTAEGARTSAAEVLGVPISNPDKPLWPARDGAAAVTKLDLAHYYAAAAEWLLPYLRGRPCTVVVAPDGIAGEVTYVRHEGHWQGLLRTSPRLRHMTVEAKAKTYPVFDTPEALVTAAEIAILEFHPWNSEPDEPMLPGRLVFDLDPDEAHDLADVAAAATELEARLLDYGLLSFVKTSGRRGLHVVAPFEQFARDKVSWTEARTFAEVLCRQMAADSPERYTTALPKAQRRGRLFLDYLRNDPGHHAAGLLTPRATPAATVSMPLGWKALRERIEVGAYTVRTAPALMREKNPWRYYEASARPLRYAVERMGSG